MLRNSEPAVNAQAFAASTRELLTSDPLLYRNFGVYWFFVKALLKRFYDRHAMPMLGAFVDQSVVERMPAGLDGNELLAGAVAEYASNAQFNQGRPRVVDADGESFLLIDTDIES